jgi:outer membrane receptor for monomeric catechols
LNARQYFRPAERPERGLELSGEHCVWESWCLSGIFTCVDASYQFAALPQPVAKTPQFSWSFLPHYDVTRGLFRRFGANLGLIWQEGHQGGNAARTAAAPGPPR